MTLVLPSRTAQSNTVVYLSARNLKSIMTTWILQQHDDPAKLTFDSKAATHNMGPSLSPWIEGPAAVRHAHLAPLVDVIPLLTIPFGLCMLIIVSLWSGILRRLALALVVLAAISTLVSLDSQGKCVLFRQTYAFLDDYTYLEGVDLQAVSGRGSTIAAYDWRTFIGQRSRIIAFADGHVEALGDDRATPLFEAQGIPYPLPDGATD